MFFGRVGEPPTYFIGVGAVPVEGVGHLDVRAVGPREAVPAWELAVGQAASELVAKPTPEAKLFV